MKKVVERLLGAPCTELECLLTARTCSGLATKWLNQGWMKSKLRCMAEVLSVVLHWAPSVSCPRLLLVSSEVVATQWVTGI